MLVLAVFAFVWGAKLRLIESCGSELPYWDQWDAEGDNLYRPYLEGELTFAALLQPHNEHRTFFTRGFALGLFEANDRQWNARVEVVANALLHTAIALLLLHFAFHVLPLGAAAAGLIALFLGMNVSWENTLSGFQATFYFFLLFSLLHLGGALLARPRSWGWWLAPLAGLATLFSMASGLLSAVAILCVTLVRGTRDRKLTRDDAFVLVTNGLLTVAGWLLKTEVPGHAELKAQSLGVWLNAWLHQLAWPVIVPGLPWPALLGLIPPLALLWCYVRGRVTGPAALTLLGASAWHVLQTMAIAYARGANDAGYSSRYTDTLAIGLVINLLALAYLATHSTTAPARQRWTVVAWVAVAFSLNGLWAQSTATEANTLAGLPEINAARTETVRAYVANRHPAFFQKAAWSELPYPDAVRLAELLDQPSLRSILPASVAPPIALTPEAASKGFGPYHETVPPGPLPPGRSAWMAGTPGDAVFRSNAFTTRHARVTLWVASDGTAAGRLRLLSDTGKAFEPLGDLQTTTPRWKRVNFAAPPGRYALEVSKTGPGWLAFTQPHTDTRLAHASSTLVSSGAWLHGGGALLGLAAALLLFGSHIARGAARIAGPTGSDPAAATPPSRGAEHHNLSPRAAYERGRRLWLEQPWFAPTACGLLVLLTLFFRRPEMFLQPQLWAEDGPIFLLQADTWGRGALTSPYGGYHLLLPRLLAAASAMLDLRMIPTAYFAASMATVLALGFALFSPRVELPHRAACFLALALLPHSGEVFGNLSNLQWLTALGLVWLLVARDAATPRQHVTDGMAAVACGLTGIYSVLFAPLFFWRAWRRRTPTSVIMLLLVGACAVVQLWALRQAADSASGASQITLAAALTFVGLRLVAGLMLPPAWAEELPASVHLGLGVAAIALLAAALKNAGPQQGLRHALIGCIVLVVAATLYRGRADLGAFRSLANGDRYLFVPKLLSVWLLISGWSASRRITRASFGACALALLAALSSWRYTRLEDYRWPDYAARIQAGEAVKDIPLNPAGISFDHPGR